MVKSAGQKMKKRKIKKDEPMNNKAIKAFVKKARKLAKPFRVTGDNFRLKDIDPGLEHESRC